MSAMVSASARPFLSLRDGVFRLGERLVFARTTWIWRWPEQWALVGGNGSGKSLLADGLCGRLPLVGGELRYHFRPGPGLSPEEMIGQVSFERSKAGWGGAVAQSRWNSLEEESSLRVRDFLAYERVMDINPFEVGAGSARARAQFERRQRGAVDLLALGPLREQTLLSLSNGERQRVELARVLCRPLRLLILDEPFVGLDAATRRHFHAALERLMAGRLRVLLVTTRPEDLPRRVTHLLQVENGQVVAAGRRAPGRAGAARGPERGAGFAPAVTAGAPGVGARFAPPGSPPPVLVALRRVTVRHGRRVILRELDWTVRAGESWAVLGPNGAGKTTLLGLVLGDHPQVYTNEVTVFGRRRGGGESQWDIKRHIGWVSPELHLHFKAAATCFEVVASGFHDSIGLFEPVTRGQAAAARRWLRRFGLLGFAGTPLFGLSAGGQRMVLLARALVKRPRLLALDEPCQGLDAAHRALFIGAVDELLRAGAVTALYITHRLDEIPPSIQRVLRLDGKGRASEETLPPGGRLPGRARA